MDLYNAYVWRGSEGVAVIDTLRKTISTKFFARLESVARYDEIKVIVPEPFWNRTIPALYPN